MNDSKKHRSLLLPLLGVGAFVLLLAGFGATVRMLREINEPDPSEYDPSQAVGLLKEGGIKAEVRYLTFVNVDYNGYVFVGDIEIDGLPKKKVETRDARLTAFEVDPVQLDRRIPGRYSYLRVVSAPDGRTAIGFIASTTRGELQQALPRFRVITDDCASNLLDMRK